MDQERNVEVWSQMIQEEPVRAVQRETVKRKYSDELKEVILAELLTGLSIRELSSKYNIPYSTIVCWKHRRPGPVPAVGPEVSGQMGAQLLAYLSEAIGALRKQLKIVADDAWLRGQRASEVAVLHIAIADKIIRLLEALDPDAQYDAPGPDIP
jgi:hypothetical protein